MKNLPTRTALLGLALATWLPAKDATSATAAEVASPPTAPTQPSKPKDPALEAVTKEQETLAADNKLQAERLVQATNAMRAEVTRLKLERELMSEKLALETTKRRTALQVELAKIDAEKEKLSKEGELSRVRAE